MANDQKGFVDAARQAAAAAVRKVRETVSRAGVRDLGRGAGDLVLPQQPPQGSPSGDPMGETTAAGVGERGAQRLESRINRAVQFVKEAVRTGGRNLTAPDTSPIDNLSPNSLNQVGRDLARETDDAARARRIGALERVINDPKTRNTAAAQRARVIMAEAINEHLRRTGEVSGNPYDPLEHLKKQGALAQARKPTFTGVGNPLGPGSPAGGSGVPGTPQGQQPPDRDPNSARLWGRIKDAEAGAGKVPQSLLDALHRDVEAHPDHPEAVAMRQALARAAGTNLNDMGPGYLERWGYNHAARVAQTEPRLEARITADLAKDAASHPDPARRAAALQALQLARGDPATLTGRQAPPPAARPSPTPGGGAVPDWVAEHQAQESRSRGGAAAAPPPSPPPEGAPANMDGRAATASAGAELLRQARRGVQGAGGAAGLAMAQGMGLDASNSPFLEAGSVSQARSLLRENMDGRSGRLRNLPARDQWPSTWERALEGTDRVDRDLAADLVKPGRTDVNLANKLRSMRRYVPRSRMQTADRALADVWRIIDQGGPDFQETRRRALEEILTLSPDKWSFHTRRALGSFPALRQVADHALDVKNNYSNGAYAEEMRRLLDRGANP